ncbi:MAG TPA: PAS domain-containing protein [Actinomycetota bacterium]|nr:PAS domain-containing protein [Actinomycetota bacterium]
MGEPADTRRPSSRPGRRDALVVAVACVGLFLLGAFTGAFDRLEPIVAQADVGDDLVGGFLLVAVGVAVLAVRSARREAREAALRADADDQIRALIAGSPVVSFTWLPQEHRYRYVSPQIETLFGVTADNHERDWSGQIHPDDRERVAELSRVADRDGSTYLAEYRIVRPDGEIRWIHDESEYYERDADGRPQLAQGVMFDITERKEAEDRAAAAEERYRTLVEKVPAISYVWDSSFAQGTVPALYISPQIEQVLGVAPQAWLDDPMAWSVHAHPDDEATVSAAWREATETGGPFSAEYRLRTMAGAWLWVRDEANPVGQGSDGGHLYQGVIVDITERHNAEEAARSAEERWRLLLEHLPLVAYQISVDDAEAVTDRWVAAGVEQLFGITVDEWLADIDAWNDAIHPDDRADVLAAWDRMQADAEPFDQQYRIVHRDGRVLWVHDRATCTRRDDIRVVEGAFVDVTGWRAAEAALLEAEGRFRTLVEQLPAIVFIEDAATGDDIYVSPQLETMYGYTAEEWSADHELWQDRLHPDDRDRVIASNTADDGDDTWGIDYRTFTRDDRMLWVHNESRLIRDADGTPLYWLGAVYDITERKAAEERLRDAEERYRTLVEQLPVAIYTDAVDEIATALYISPQYEALTGYTPEQRMLNPELWVQMLHPDDRARVLAESNATNDTGEPFDVEYRIVAADGRTVWLHDHAVQVTDAHGRGRWHGVLQDVTDAHLAADAVARRDAILEATSVAAARFLRSAEWEAHLPEVLERLGRAGEAQRCSVYRNIAMPDGGPGVQLVQAWAVGGIVADDEPFPWEGAGFERWAVELAAGRPIHGNVDAFPVSEQGILGSQPFPIRSLIVVPIFVDGAWWGYVAFDHTDAHERFDTEIEALTVTASTLGAAIERELAVGRLDEAETLYRSLIEHLPAVTYIEDPVTGDNLYMSPQVHSFLGYSDDEWGTFAQWLDTVHPDDRDRALARDDESTGDGTPFRCEYRLRRKSGDTVWVRDEAYLVRNLDGSERYWQGVLFDITAEKEAEQQIRQAEERYRLLVEEMPAISYLSECAPAGEGWPTRYISPQIERLLGFTPEDWLADPTRWSRLLHPDDRERAAAADAAHYETGEPLDIELRVFDKDGNVVWLRDQAVIIRDDDGAPLFSQGIMFDVTERKLAEERLADAEQRYRAIVEHVPAAIYLHRPTDSMDTVYMSPQVADIVGVPPEAWIADPDLWYRLVLPEDRDVALTSFFDAVERGDNWRAEYRMRTPDGRIVWIHDETTFLTDEHGEPMLVQGVMFDVTERKLAEQALRESEQREREAAERLRALDEMKNTFLAAVSHELRSPLTSILGLALTLERAPDIKGQDRDDLLSRLAANAKKLDRLLKDLLDIDRLNRGIVEPQYRVTDVSAIARRTVEHLDALAGREIIVQTDPVVIPVDPPKIERIVENLLMNAARHTDADTRIWLIVTPYEGGVRITVEDDGSGVPPELRAAIFEPFRQGPTRSPHAPGTGIGLSLVARFAELHGGRAWADERDGGGAAFHVVIPGKVPDHAQILRDVALPGSAAHADAG